MTQAGDRLRGLCYSDGCLYVAERREAELGRDRYSLAVYRVQPDSGDIKLLDRLTLMATDVWCPRVNRHSQRVFIPCYERGVTVARLNGDRLVRERRLTCVRDAISLDVMSSDTVYVGDGISYSVAVVDIRADMITMTLEKPDTVREYERPYRLAVLGDSVMVCYGHGYDDPTLVIYRHNSPTPVMVIPRPGGLNGVSAVSTDCHSHFMVTDGETSSVFVMDSNGDLRHTVKIDADSRPRDSAVVNRQLWVGCGKGDIFILSSQ